MRFLNLRRMVVSMVDLPAFVEQEGGVSVIGKDTDSAKCRCPLHGDTNPSFSMTKHDDGWGYKCFGCQSSGTVVEFFQEFYEIDNSQIALQMICEKLGLDDEIEVLKSSLDNMAEKKIDTSKEIESIHIMASDLCRTIARECGDEKVVKWVNRAYATMNKALECRDYASIEMVYDMAREFIEDEDFTNI